MRLDLSRREIYGVIFAPLTGFIIFIVPMSFLGLGVINLGEIALYAFALSYAGMFLFGVPIILALKRSGDLRLAPLLFFGSVAGLLFYPLCLYLIFRDGFSLGVGNMLFGSFEGAIVALTYGVIAKVRIRRAAS